MCSRPGGSPGSLERPRRSPRLLPPFPMNSRRVIFMPSRSAAVLALLAATAAAFSAPEQPPEEPPLADPAQYAGQSVVRVVPSNVRELRAAAGVALDVWTHSPRVGRPLDLRVDARGLGALRGLGLDPREILPDVEAHVRRSNEQIRAGALPALARGTADAFYDAWRPLADLEARIDAIVAASGGVASVSEIGRSHQNRPIRAVRITAPGDASRRAQLLILGTQHAREWISPMTVVYLVDAFVEGYANDPDVRAMLESVELVVVPVVNPDGFEYTWSSDRYWRKNRHPYGAAVGVDLNRNWAEAWGGEGSSGSPGSETYRGPAPFSEPETAAVRDLALDLPRLGGFLDIHSYGQLILWPWGSTYDAPPAPWGHLHADAAHTMEDAIEAVPGASDFDPMQSSSLYPAGGDVTDWMFAEFFPLAYTIELPPSGGGGFNPHPSLIRPTAESIFAGVRAFVPFAAEPVRFPYAVQTPSVSGTVAPAAVSFEPVEGYGAIDHGSGLLSVRYADTGAEFPPIPAPSAGGVFSALLPNAPCGAVLEVTPSAANTAGVRAEAGTFAVPVGEVSIALSDGFETDTGWTPGDPSDTATSGRWQRARPSPSNQSAAQPTTQTTPGGRYAYLTGAVESSLGSNDVDGGRTTLYSPVIDAAPTSLELSVWFSNDLGAAPDNDFLEIAVSGDAGATWHVLDTIRTSTNGWERRAYPLAGLLPPDARTRLRFVAADLGAGAVVEAAIDDVALQSVGCPACPADVDGEPGVAVGDLLAFLGRFRAGDTSVDWDHDARVGVSDLLGYLGAFRAGCE